MKLWSLLLLFSLSCIAYSQEIPRVHSVQFDGANYFTHEQLLQQISNQPNSALDMSAIAMDMQKLSDFYATRGFFEVKVFYPQIKPISPLLFDLVFKIQEQGKTVIDSIAMVGNSYFSRQKLLMFTGLEKQTVPLLHLSQKMQDFIDLYNSRGFLFAQVTIDSVEYCSNRHILCLTIKENQLCHFSKLLFEGNNVTNEKTLLQIARLQSNTLANLTTIKQAEDNLRKKEYIRDAHIVPINPSTFLINITEEKMTRISGIAGFNNKATQSNRFSGFLQVDLFNLYGTDRNFSLIGKKQNQNRSSIRINYHESGFKEIPIAGDLGLYREVVDSTYIQSTVDLSLYYYTISAQYGILTGTDDYYPGTRRPKTIEKSSRKKLGVLYSFSNLDNSSNPTKGTAISYKQYYIFQKEENKSYNKLVTELAYQQHIALNRHWVLSFLLNGKQIENKKLSFYELYPLGGTFSLRGFLEDQYSGNRIGWTNTELRYLLSWRSRLFLFWDYGYVEIPDGNSVRKLSDLHGFGFGLRLDSKIGIIGLDYGLHYAEGAWASPSEGTVHFGIETNF